MALFNYKLKSVIDCGFPKTRNGHKSVSWFWLTDSNYYLDLGDVRLFECSAKYIGKHHLASAFDDYYYIRQLEDLFDILPNIANAIPADLFSFIDTAEKREVLRKTCDELADMSEGRPDEIDVIHEFLDYAQLDTGYLSARSECQFFHIGERLIIQYDFRAQDDDGVPVWSATAGQLEMPYERFVDEIGNLLTRFFHDMDRQIEEAIEQLAGEVFYDVLLSRDEKKGITSSGVDYLRKEHAERKAYFFDVFHQLKNNELNNSLDWERVRTVMQTATAQN